MNRSPTFHGCVLGLMLFGAVLYGFVALDMCLNEGCPAYDVDLGGAER